MTSMTDPIPDATSEPVAAPAATAAPAAAPDLADRMKSLGQEAQVRGEQLGREAQAAGDRWAKDPRLVGAASTANRVFGLVLIAAGAWFLADVTLGYSLPTIPWRDLWPALLVVLGLIIIGRGMTRRA
jgi:hypothetical protein